MERSGKPFFCVLGALVLGGCCASKARIREPIDKVGYTHSDFGVDRAGYRKAVARDRRLTKVHLEGEVKLEKVKGLYHRLVQKDYHKYRITWCGRFSVPFGVALLGRTASKLGRPPVRGFLLRYGTTLDPGRSSLKVPGLGVTAPAGLRHWVGFAAVGYR